MNYSVYQVEDAVRTELRIAAEEIEAGFMARDTNNGRTYCTQCGTEQIKRRPKGQTFRHDPECPIAMLRRRAHNYDLEKASVLTKGVSR